ncbi:MAG: MBL fold metallo-hydrolase [Candidatus Portnoybacteria bacterium]|nr:MBL fold metallo-hydrolase [Candidatus Portnoybacteria bacterium]
MIQKFKRKFIPAWLGILAVVAIFVWLAVFAKAQSNFLEVNFFDIGQGKAIFIESPDGNQILIDGGPDNSVLEKLSEKMPFFDRSIDILILTHSDSDHLNGLIEVLKRYEIGRIVQTDAKDPSAAFQIWQNLIKEKNIPVLFALGGQKIKIGEGFLIEILYPNRSLAQETLKNTNAGSIVARLIYGQNSFLFTGDSEEATESYLLGTGAKIDSDILDVSHHGSKNSSSQEFIDAISPEIAVIQTGVKNRYGHPHQEALDRLKEARIFRTDLCGDILILSDGGEYQIEASCP